MDNYRVYREIKLKLMSASYNRVGLSNLVAAIVFEKLSYPKRVSVLKGILLLLFSCVKWNRELARYKKIITWLIPREDHRQIVDYVAAANKSHKLIRLNCTGHSEIRRLDLRVWFKAFKAISKCNLNVFEWLLVFPSAVYVVAALDELDNLNPDITDLTVFNSSVHPESILCAYVSSRGGRTKSLQHGIYYHIRNGYPFDVVNYDNVVAQKLLVWGQFSLDQIADYFVKNNLVREYELVVAGYPRITKFGENSTVVDDRIIVLLPRSIYIEESLLLLEILGAINNFEFVIRPHPSIRDNAVVLEAVSAANNMVIDTTAVLSDSFVAHGGAFVIGFNTSALLESLLYNKLPLQFEVDNSEFISNDLPAFRNATEACQVLSGGIAASAIDELKNYYFADGVGYLDV